MSLFFGNAPTLGAFLKKGLSRLNINGPIGVQNLFCEGPIGVQNLFCFGAIGVQNLFCIVNLNGGQAGTIFWVCLNSSLVRRFWVFLNSWRTAIPPYIDLKL
jgi:hypothetical protein